MADKKKIVLRRGPSIDLPGKPRAIAPKEWNASLDEGEMAFSADETRLFVGPNPESDLPQSRRLQYPYRNIEVVGENSLDAFARMHGDRMREGGNHDYYVSKLTSVFAVIPTGFIDATVIISADIVSFAGRRLKVFSAAGGSSFVAQPEARATRLPTPARYWRIRGFDNDTIFGAVLHIREMGLHETIGGPNIIDQATPITPAGGRDQFSDNYSPGDNPSKVKDGNLETIYYGRYVDFDPTMPLRFRLEGLVFDFGAGNEKWIAEASFVWGRFINEYIQITIEFSHDKLLWTRAYLGESSWPVDYQTRYIPERIDPYPNNLTRFIEMYANRKDGAAKVRIAEVSLHETVGGPPLQIWAPTTGFSADPTNAYDGNILNEWVSFSNYTQLDGTFRLFNKSTVRQIKVTGPLDPTQAPKDLYFYWGDSTSSRTGKFFYNLTWTSHEVKTFDIEIVNEDYYDAVQIPLN